MFTPLRLRVTLHALLLTLLFALPVQAQMGSIRGTVTDAETGDPLPGSNVIVLSQNIGASTGLDGSYRINLPAGTYTIQASFIGYVAKQATVTVSTGQPATQDFSLEVDYVGAGEVVVLGTRREGRTVTESPVPVDVISPAEIQATGLTETTQILQLLVPSYNAPQASITDGSDHVRPATLRGLGPDQVLILVNGKRRHTSALVHVNGSVGRGSTGADLNAIPASSIERIEVLRDGAAAQYGSDAISGVINIVLKDRLGFDGLVSYGQYISTVERGYTESEANRPSDDASSFNWDNPNEAGGQLIGPVEDVTYTDGGTLNLHLGYGLGIGEGSLYVSGQVRHRDHTNRSGLDPRQQYYDGFSGGTATEQTFDRENHRYGNGEFDDLSIFLNGSVPVGEGNTKVYAFGGASDREGLTGCFFRRSLDDRTNRSLYPDGFLPKINAKVNDISAAAGVKGNMSGWAYDLSETFGTNHFTFDMTDTHNASMNNSPTEFDAGTLGFAQATTNLDVFRSVGIGTAAPLSIAIGGEFRWENYTIDAGDDLSYFNGEVPVRDGPSAGASTAPGSQCFPGFAPNSQQDETRSNFGFYIDLENNVTSQFLVSLAGRFENYSDFGSTVTVKLAARYEFLQGLALRGAVSTGFRAPSLAQNYFTSLATNFIDGVPFEVGTFPVSSPVAQALGAADLDAEKSVNLSAGVTYSRDNFSLTVDAYQIDLTDRITFTENFTSSAVADFLQDPPNNLDANGGRFFTNALDTRTQGIDIIARLAEPIGPGTARFTAAVNFNDTEVTNSVVDPNNPFVRNIPATSQLTALGEASLVGRDRLNDFEGAQPDSKMNVQINYDLNAWRFLVRANRYGKYQEVNSGPPNAQSGINERDQTFDPVIFADVEVAYTVRSGINLAFGANNVFDTYPEKVLKINSNNGIFPYSGFSPSGFFGRFVYSRLTVRL